MSKNVTVAGASYADVPSVELPVTGGGTAAFYETSDATATADEILSGYTAYVNGGQVTGTASGGGSLTVTGMTIKHYADKLIYNPGETFSPTGMVVEATFSDGSNTFTRTVTDYTYSPSGALAAGDSVIISYGGYTADAGVDVVTALRFWSEDGSFTLKSADTPLWTGTIQYSTDMSNWNTWDGSEISSGADNKLFVRGTSNTRITSNGSAQSDRCWVLQGSDIRCDGNIETLLDYATVANGNHPTMGTYCFAYLFYYCVGLITAPTLPATALALGCYYGMFSYCSNLEESPALPATTLQSSCYTSMFFHCINLKSAPTLSATTMTTYCYQEMFRECANIEAPPALPATALANYCYRYMFRDCEKLKTAPSLPATTLTNGTGCYYGMFSGCTNLTTAPALPATTLISDCYREMFEGCTNIKTPPTLSATTLASNCYYRMFMGSGLTTAPALAATSLQNNCYQEMFYSCKKLTTAPTLSASTLADSCYRGMFYSCSGLTAPPALPATTLGANCYYQMFYGCTSITTAPALSATALQNYCYQQMFYNCTNLEQLPALPATALKTSCYQQMFYGCSKIKLSQTKTGAYVTNYRIPKSGNGSTASNALANMFASTGGTFTGAPTINTTYYTSNMVVSS